MGEAAALLNAVVWALTGVVTKGVGKDVKPVHIVSAQVWIGISLLLLVGLAVGQLDDLVRTPIGSALMLAGGAVINTAGSLVFWIAMSRGSVSSVYPTTQSIFILISVFAGWIFLDDPPDIGIIGGAALIIGGVILLNWRKAAPRPGETGSTDIAAIGLAVATAFLWAGGFVSTALGLEEAEPLPAATIRNLVPALLFAVVAIAYPKARLGRVFRPNAVRLTVGSFLFAFSALTFVFALDKASAGVVVILVNTSPMWAVLLATIVLRERLNRFALAGAACSVAGIFVTLWLG